MQAVAVTAIPRRSRHGGTGSGRRGLSAGVLALWIAFLLLNALQPCCEALAAQFSHPHDHASEHLAVEAGRSGSDWIPVGGHDHSHCANSDGADTSLPSFLTSTPVESEAERLPVGLVLSRLYSPVPSLREYPLDDHQRGPPGRRYLDTLRLRI